MVCKGKVQQNTLVSQAEVARALCIKTRIKEQVLLSVYCSLCGQLIRVGCTTRQPCHSQPTTQLFPSPSQITQNVLLSCHVMRQAMAHNLWPMHDSTPTFSAPAMSPALVFAFMARFTNGSMTGCAGMPISSCMLRSAASIHLTASWRFPACLIQTAGCRVWHFRHGELRLAQLWNE